MSASSVPRIALYQFGTSKIFAPLPTFDPRCLAAQTYLRLAGVPFVEEIVGRPETSPINILPVLALNRKKTILHHDIFTELSEMGYNLDVGLSDKDAADLAAWRSLIEGQLFNAQLFNWFAKESNFDEVISLVYADQVSIVQGFYLPGRYRKSVMSHLSVVGMLDEAHVYRQARKLYSMLSKRLGDHPYFGGEDPCSLDATAFGFLATQFIPNLPDNTLRFMILEHPNLVKFIENMITHCFKAKVPLGIDPEPAKRWLEAQISSTSQKAQTLSHHGADFRSSLAIALGVGITVLFVALQNVHVGFVAKWLGYDLSYLPSIKSVDPHPNTMFRGDSGVTYVEDDGDAYDLDEGYLRTMQTGEYLPDEAADLDDFVDE